MLDAADPAILKFEKVWTNEYFAGRMIKTQDEWVAAGRLGSVRWHQTRGKITYFPYGEIRTEDYSPYPTQSNHLYATYLSDKESTLDYADQRYYQNTAARFLTPDPYQASGGPGDPGSWNRYSYVQGDPVNSNDPSGLLTIIIGGTVLNPFGGSTAAWGQPGTEFHRSVSNFFGEEAVVVEWSGKLFDRVFSGAAELAAAVKAHKFSPGEKLNIVAHSHGGNAAKAFTEMGVRYVDTLITMGTPQRHDFQAAYWSIGNYFNIYSKFDVVQRVGGPWTRALWAGRTDRFAIISQSTTLRVFGRVSHGDLHSPQVWREMENWLGRAGYGVRPENVNGGCWSERDLSLPSHSKFVSEPMSSISFEESLW